MNISRPFTAARDRKGVKSERKTLFDRTKRPFSAKNDTLRKIIQVIQNTLNKGAQTILTKTKTLEKFSKIRNLGEASNFWKQKESKFDRFIPHFKTQFAIGSSGELQKFSPTIKSSIKIYPTIENEEFVPYMKQPSVKTESAQVYKNSDSNKTEKGKKGRAAYLKKSTRQLKPKQQSGKQQNLFELRLNQIGKWENQSTFLNMSYLLKSTD